MIRYRPYRSSLSSSVKDEQIFSGTEELLSFILETWCRILSFTRADIVIDTAAHPNPMVGYRSERRILIGSLCIGYCDAEVI